MGKIFDALKKSGAGKQTSAARGHKADGAQPRPAEVVDLFEEDPQPPSPALPISCESTGPALPSEVAGRSLGTRYAADRISKTLVTIFKPHTSDAEQFKILRTRILNRQSAKAIRTILVTSALPGEGKSFVAANLAVSIAQSIKEQVLLIDCDLRQPCLHTLFGFGHEPGLSEYLADGLPLTDLLLKTAVAKLTLLPSGKPAANPSELLSSERMFGLIKEVRQRYSDRYIVIDAPPINLTAEGGAPPFHASCPVSA